LLGGQALLDIHIRLLGEYGERRQKKRQTKSELCGHAGFSDGAAGQRPALRPGNKFASVLFQFGVT
jgi:hypothetical protein